MEHLESLPELTYGPVDVEVILELRHTVLRQGLPFESARFLGDALPTTRHYAAFICESGRPICCASFMFSSFEDASSWQLRGMATSETYRGLGIGAALLAHAEKSIAANSDVRLLWCNARLGAVRFYEKQGWQCVSDIFDVPDAGPHRKMIKKL